ncbi:MAG TPA: thioredoxin domain-containing protein, partial [Brevundimonas sp.]
MHLIQRLFLVLMLATSPLAVASVASAAELPPVTANDRVLGRADAPVMVVEYASFTCSHCADWHKDVFPAFKARYIDTGKVRLVYRNLP